MILHLKTLDSVFRHQIHFVLSSQNFYCIGKQLILNEIKAGGMVSLVLDPLLTVYIFKHKKVLCEVTRSGGRGGSANYRFTKLILLTSY